MKRLREMTLIKALQGQFPVMVLSEPSCNVIREIMHPQGH